MNQTTGRFNVIRIFTAGVSLLLRGLRRLSRNPYFVGLASISSIIALGVTTYQIANQSPLQHLDSVQWTKASVDHILRDDVLARSIRGDKTGAGEIAFIRFNDADDPMARFWRELSLAISQGDIELADHGHTTLRQLTEGVKSLEISESEKETLLFYVLQRVVRMRSAHLRSTDDPVLVAYLETISDIGYVSGEIRSPWLSRKAANEFQVIAESIAKGPATRAQVEFAMNYARWGYIQAGVYFPRTPAFAAWRAVLQTFEDLIIARHRDLWREARGLVDVRVAIANSFLEMKAGEDVLVSELRTICTLAARCESAGSSFPASWARLKLLELLESVKVPKSLRPVVASEVLQCMLPMAVRDVDVSGAAEETADVMAGACEALGAELCSETIGKFKQALDPKAGVRFRRFETKLFRPDGGHFLPSRRLRREPQG